VATASSSAIAVRAVTATAVVTVAVAAIVTVADCRCSVQSPTCVVLPAGWCRRRVDSNSTVAAVVIVVGLRQ
jgi:hypothetical protein